MKTKWRNGRGGVISCLAGALLAASLGCNAANNTGASSSTNKTSSHIGGDTKGTSSGTPKKDMGK